MRFSSQAAAAAPTTMQTLSRLPKFSPAFRREQQRAAHVQTGSPSHKSSSRNAKKAQAIYENPASESFAYAFTHS